MTLTLGLSPELEERLKKETERSGMNAEEYTLQLLDEHLPPGNHETDLVDLLQSWIEDDDGEEEQRETGEYLIRVLDEDRTSERKLFPQELEGVSW